MSTVAPDCLRGDRTPVATPQTADRPDTALVHLLAPISTAASNGERRYDGKRHAAHQPAMKTQAR
jgi:hypothetical protein